MYRDFRVQITAPLIVMPRVNNWGVRPTNSMSPTRTNFDPIGENEKSNITNSAKQFSAEISGTGLPRQNEIS